MKNVKVLLSVSMMLCGLSSEGATESERTPFGPKFSSTPKAIKPLEHVPASATGSVAASSIAASALEDGKFHQLLGRLEAANNANAKLMKERKILIDESSGYLGILTRASAVLSVETSAEIPAAVQAVQAKLTAAETSLSQLSMLLGAEGEDPIVKARGINQRINRLEALLGVEEGGDILAAASRLRETNATATAAHAADITALRADFEARMAAKDRENAAALGLVQQEVSSLRAIAAAAQARVSELEPRLTTATDLLGEVRDEGRQAVVKALDAAATTFADQAGRHEDWLARKATKPSARAPRGYGSTTMTEAAQPLLAPEHGAGSSSADGDPAATLQGLRDRAETLHRRATELSGRPLTPPHDAVTRRLTEPSYRATFGGISRSPLRVREAGTSGSING